MGLVTCTECGWNHHISEIGVNMQKHKTAIFLKHVDGPRASELIEKREKTRKISTILMIVAYLLIVLPILLEITARSLKNSWLLEVVTSYNLSTWIGFGMVLFVFSYLVQIFKPNDLSISSQVSKDIEELARICSVTTDALYESSETESFTKFAEKVLIEKAYSILVIQDLLKYHDLRLGRTSANRMVRQLLEREENLLKVKLREDNAILHMFGAGREDIGWAFEEAEKMM